MSLNRRHEWQWMPLLFAAVFLFVGNAKAETRTVRIATQYGISYLPMTIMAEKNLLEAEGKKRGLDLKAEWVRFTGGPPMNEALISGNLGFCLWRSGPAGHDLGAHQGQPQGQRDRRT